MICLSCSTPRPHRVHGCMHMRTWEHPKAMQGARIWTWEHPKATQGAHMHTWEHPKAMQGARICTPGSTPRPRRVHACRPGSTQGHAGCTDARICTPGSTPRPRRVHACTPGSTPRPRMVRTRTWEHPKATQGAHTHLGAIWCFWSAACAALPACRAQTPLAVLHGPCRGSHPAGGTVHHKYCHCLATAAATATLTASCFCNCRYSWSYSCHCT